MGRNIITKDEFINELNKNTNNFSVTSTSELQKVSLVAYTIADLMANVRYDRGEVNLLTEILRNKYIPGLCDIYKCYELYVSGGNHAK